MSYKYSSLPLIYCCIRQILHRQLHPMPHMIGHKCSAGWPIHHPKAPPRHPEDFGLQGASPSGCSGFQGSTGGCCLEFNCLLVAGARRMAVGENPTGAEPSRASGQRAGVVFFFFFFSFPSLPCVPISSSRKHHGAAAPPPPLLLLSGALSLLCFVSSFAPGLPPSALCRCRCVLSLRHRRLSAIFDHHHNYELGLTTRLYTTKQADLASNHTP
jgi:hypothetical protein